jgi:hypothetical protein
MNQYRVSLMVLALAASDVAQAQSSFCVRLFEGGRPDRASDKILKLEGLANSIAKERACIETLFVGDADHWSTMSSAEVREHADWLNRQFAVYESIPSPTRKCLSFGKDSHEAAENYEQVVTALGKKLPFKEFVVLSRI